MTSPERTVCSRWNAAADPQLPVDPVRVVGADVYDLRVLEAESLLERHLQVGVGAGGRPHRDAHDALRLCLSQEPRDLGLRQAQARGDLGLLDARLVVQPRNPGHESQLVDARHVTPPACRRRAGEPPASPA